PGQGVRVVFLGNPKDPEGCQVELLEPLSRDCAVSKFLSERGPGLHHLAFRAGAVEAAMKRLYSAGLPALEAAPRPGARGHQVCFLHPKRCHGVLVELVGSSAV
ncbi:MAG: VOC family protein, partial [Elusimicrobiota bacterium]